MVQYVVTDWIDRFEYYDELDKAIGKVKTFWKKKKYYVVVADVVDGMITGVYRRGGYFAIKPTLFEGEL